MERPEGAVIRDHRIAKGLTQRALAQMIGVSPAAVGQWETGTERPKRANAIALDEALGAQGDIASAFGYVMRAADPDGKDRQHLLERIDALDGQVAALTTLIQQLIGALGEQPTGPQATHGG